MALFQRRHYRVLAEAIRTLHPTDRVWCRALVDAVGAALRADNSRYNHDLFLQEAGFTDD